MGLPTPVDRLHSTGQTPHDHDSALALASAPVPATATAAAPAPPPSPAVKNQYTDARKFKFIALTATNCLSCLQLNTRKYEQHKLVKNAQNARRKANTLTYVLHLY